MLVADRWRVCDVLAPFKFFSKCDFVSESDVAILQQRFEVLVAPRQQRVGVSTGQNRTALMGLAGRRWGCRVVRNEEGDYKCHHHRTGAQEERRTGDCGLLHKTGNKKATLEEVIKDL